MTSQPDRYCLLILSQHCETYSDLISQGRLPGLSIIATDDPSQAILQGGVCDMLFGEPSLVGTVLNELPIIKWVQRPGQGLSHY